MYEVANDVPMFGIQGLQNLPRSTFLVPYPASHPHGWSLDKQVYCWLTDMPSVFPSPCLGSHHSPSWRGHSLLFICPNSTLFSRFIHSSAMMLTPPCCGIRIKWPNKKRPGFGPKWICLSASFSWPSCLPSLSFTFLLYVIRLAKTKFQGCLEY